ncbi:MAG: glycoside hydrolase family 5 protein [Eubacterium sp.]|nr:glycoside hydrolase family 5 protein [Eubacterium sp.]
MKKLISLLLAIVLMMSFYLSFSISANAESLSESTVNFDKDKTSFQILEEIKIGWNLGNTFDSWDGVGLESETSWGNPKTTEKMILDIKKMGFNTIRIPVTWSIHTEEGKIDGEWLMRVKEVVDYAYNNGMYVILNSHHDDDYFDIGACVENENTYEANIKKISDLWVQIANAFKDYDERLLFETMNEPRAKGSEKEWLGGTAEEREVVYALNDAIVKAIRTTGGNNEYRHILIPDYAANSNTSILKKMKLPDDDRIIVSIHAYIPYSFAMDANGPTEFSKADKKEIDKLFRNLNKIFISKGIPVIMGEFGAVNKDNLDNRCAWAEYYVKCAGQYGIPCLVWDNNIEKEIGAECYGLYNRNTGEWYFPELAQTMIKSADEAVKITDKANTDITLPIVFIVSAVIIFVLILIFVKRKKH